MRFVLLLLLLLLLLSPSLIGAWSVPAWYSAMPHMCIANEWTPLGDTIASCLKTRGNHSQVWIGFTEGVYNLAPGAFDAAVGNYTGGINSMAFIGFHGGDFWPTNSTTWPPRIVGSFGASNKPFGVLLSNLWFDFDKYDDCAMGAYTSAVSMKCTFVGGHGENMFDLWNATATAAAAAAAADTHFTDNTFADGCTFTARAKASIFLEAFHDNHGELRINTK